MFLEIKSKIEQEFINYIRGSDKLYRLTSISPLLFDNIKEFLYRKGKRVRPVLFAVGYLAYSKKPASGLYRSAVSLELLHDFMLVHDDIIDKSDTRRGKPSMHTMFNAYLLQYKKPKFSGQDLTIVAGDVMFAMAMDAFLSIKENPERKEAGLRKLIEAAFYTGSGEFVELINGLKTIEETTKEDIYKVYDLKTANYTFASPLTMGATLAGASKKEINKLFDFGIYIGRAFQIKDDIIGIFSTEEEIGKPNLTDIREGKITLLIWQAFKSADRKTRLIIKSVMSKKNAGKKDLLVLRKIIKDTGSLRLAEQEINNLINKGEKVLEGLKMHPRYKKSLINYINDLLNS